MVTGISSRLIQETNRLFTQLHEVPLEPQIANPSLVFVTIAPVILEKERETARRVEEDAFDRDFLYLRCL